MEFEKPEKIFNLLREGFPEKPVTRVSSELLTIYEGNIVYDYFHEKTWPILSKELDFKKDGEALEKGIIYLNANNLLYYFPLYIYASLLNKNGWAFEYSFFYHYLTPGVMSDHDFLEFIDNFNPEQKEILYLFVEYKAKVKCDLMAIDAFDKYWELYQ